MRKYWSRSSPKGGKRGCLGPDGTYHVKWCDGSLRAQGIGNITRQVTPTTYDLFIPLNSDSLITSDGLTFKVTSA